MRAVFKFNNGEYLNVPADSIDIRDGWVGAWNGESLVAIAKADVLDSCHLSDKKEDQNGH